MPEMASPLDRLDAAMTSSSSSTIQPGARTTSYVNSDTVPVSASSESMQYPLPNDTSFKHQPETLPKTADLSDTVVGRAPTGHQPSFSFSHPQHSYPPPLAANSPIKRKPLSVRASSSLATSLVFSPLPATTTVAAADLAKPETRFARPPSIDSPILYDEEDGDYQSVLDHLPQFEKLDFDFTSAGSELPQISSDSHHPHGSSTDGHSDILSDYDDIASQYTPDVTTINALSDDHQPVSSSPVAQKTNSRNVNNFHLPMFAPKPIAPHLKLEQVDTAVDVVEHDDNHHHDGYKSETHTLELEPSLPKLNKPLPKSPSQGGAVLQHVFSWGNTSPSATEFSSLPSPSTPTRGGLTHDTLPATESGSLSLHSQSNVASNPLGYCESYLSTPPPQTSAFSVQIEEMEDELQAISSELAASIRREIDLEDLVDRLQEQVNNPQAPGKRTSDYFSDSGYSSAKLSDYDHSREEIEKIQRRSEQEKASVRLELTNKLQDERAKRRALDQQVKELAERASQMDLAEINNLDANGRLKELEQSCDDLRRKLAEERDSKTNIEDLLSALKSELNDTSNERDNLRDEVVPQLRARVEGLEAEASAHASLTYESTKMQHQLQSLQQENTSLRNSTMGMEDIMARSGGPGGLSRSDSLMRSQRATAGPRPDTKNLLSESREVLAERLKDVEAQRDALHNALKNLLERQEFQNRENEKRIKILEKERSRLLFESPKKAGFERDISNLRTEINVLRKRSEDASEQKWQVEKGLAGLKMDLDRAEEEITTLRGLLQENDILIPVGSEVATQSGPVITSETLKRSYDQLRTQYNESLERIKQLELTTGNGQDEKTKFALKRLEDSLNSALSQRDAARLDVNGLQSQYDNLASNTAKNVNSERALADELIESATRVEQLATQVKSQLATNAELRQRLTDTVTRGDQERKSNSERIASLQDRLRGLEDQVIVAQSASEESIGRHEEEIAKIKEAHNEQLRRLHNGGSVGMTGPQKKSILNSAAGSVFARANNLPAKTFEDELEVKKLRDRVTELERALTATENEMQEVVGKMNTAQIEVMTLQEERETAIRETRRLEAMVKQEQASPFASRLRMLGMAA